jgi:hypothetical protein
MPASLIPVVDQSSKRFAARRVCVVADRGMISIETIAELEARGLLYILGIRERNDNLARDLGLVSRVRRPHSRQFAPPMQSRQRDRVPPVRLDAFRPSVSGSELEPPPCSRAESVDLTMKTVSRRPGFEAYMHSVVSIRQSLDRPLDRQWAILDVPEKSDLSRPALPRSQQVLLLGEVESHIGRWRIGVGSPASNSSIPRSKSSSRKGLMRSKTLFGYCVVSRSNSL